MVTIDIIIIDQIAKFLKNLFDFEFDQSEKVFHPAWAKKEMGSEIKVSKKPLWNSEEAFIWRVR